MNLRFNVRESLFRNLYWPVNKLDKNGDVRFMNFGFSEKYQLFKTNKDHESEMKPIRLFHLLANEAEIRNKNIVEIGCGDILFVIL